MNEPLIIQGQHYVAKQDYKKGELAEFIADPREAKQAGIKQILFNVAHDLTRYYGEVNVPNHILFSEFSKEVLKRLENKD